MNNARYRVQCGISFTLPFRETPLRPLDHGTSAPFPQFPFIIIDNRVR